MCSAPAFAAGVGTPDGRIDVGADAGPGGSGFEAGVDGRLGAYAFSNRAGVSSGGARLTNPPLSGAWALGRGGFAIERDETFGPPTAHATLGTGGITEGVDEAGRLTGLGWPGPGWYDHVDHIHVSRGHPNAGAPVNGGSFAGAGNAWLTPEHGWRTVAQGWASDTAQTLVTTLEHPERGLAATITDVVDPTADLIARNVRFSHPAGAFAYYANFSPTTSRLPRAPSVTDGVGDAFSDFATVYDDARSQLLHFRPYRADPVPVTTIATSHEGAARAREAVRGAFGPGVYIATAGQGRAAEHQAGLDSQGFVRGEAEGTPLLDPYYDLADGRLSGSDAAFGLSAGALSGLPPDADGSYTVYLAAGESAADAMGIVEHARVRGFARIRADSEAWWHSWLARARLPATTDARTLAVSRHALMLIRTAMDRRSGSIVANATVQTPYRQDWVRDGAFFNYALLLAGYPELAKQHADFYRRVYRPGGTWDSLYYSDGGEAGFVYPYEIDSQAFALWALWLPAEFDPTDRAYLERVYPAISDTANALLLCRDPFNGLQCYAPEDDAVQPTQGTQGASTVYLALRSATAAARALGIRPNPRWAERAAELRAAALGRLCNGGACGGGRGGVYMVWPSRLLDPASSLAQRHLRGYVRELDARASFASPDLGGFFQYPMEPLLALAPFWTDPAREERLAAWVRWLTHDVAEPGVLHYGERIFRVAEPGAGPVYLHSVGFPHIWSGTEMYIAAAFVHGLRGCPAGRQVGEAHCRG
jgi:hypothetical protein